MTIKQKAKRNVEIYNEYFHARKTKAAIAEERNLSWVQVDRIIKSEIKANQEQQAREEGRS